MSLSCSAKDWTEGDLEGVPSPCQSSIKEACLTCCRYLPTFWSHTWGAPSWKTLSTKAIRRTPLQERSPPNLRYWEHVFSVCPHQCSWQAWHACEPSEGLLLCFCGGKRCQEVSEAAAPRAPASSYEALLLSAGKCGQSPSCTSAAGRAAFASTQTLGATCTSADTWVQSPPQHLCQKHTHIKVWWYRSSLAANQQPQPPLFPFAPQPSTSCRSCLTLHSLAQTPALLPAHFFLKNPLDGGQNN